MTGALDPFYDRIVNPDPGIDPGDIVDGVDQGLGYESWKASPNQIYITSEQDMIDASMEQPANAEYPNGFYTWPADKQLLCDGDIVYSKPLVAPIGSASIKMVQPLVDSLIFTGALGSGPVSRGETAGLVVDGGASLFTEGMTLASATPGTVGIILGDGELLSTNLGFAHQKAFSVYGGSELELGGTTLIFLQNTPSTVTLAAAEVSTLRLNNVENAGTGIFATSGNIFDFTGADAGDLRVEADSVSLNITNVAWDGFVVTDDNTMKQATFNNCVLIEGSVGDFISGIDETSVNTTFSGNNFPNTNINGSIGVDGNALPTLNPGVINTWVPIVGNTVIGVKTTRYDDNGGQDYVIRYIGDNQVTPALATGGNIRRAAGAGSIDIRLGVFVNGVFDSDARFTIDGNLRSIPNIPITVPLQNGDIIDFRLAWPVSTTVDAVVEDFGAQLRL